MQFFWLTVAALKLFPKLLHQMLALVLHRNFKALEVGIIRSNWPVGSALRRRKDFVGLTVASIDVSPHKVMVTNDIGHLESEKTRKNCNYVQLISSLRLQNFLGRLNSGESLEVETELSTKHAESLVRMESCIKLERARVSVLQGLNGQVRVVDGTHRLIALYARDGNLRNIDFLITI